MSPRIPRLLRFVVLVAIAFAFLLFVWPTPYRYDHILVEGDTYPVRINRLNGDADMLTPDDGWVPMEAGSGNQQNQALGRRSPAGGARSHRAGAAGHSRT